MGNSGLDTISDAADSSIARRSPSQSPQVERTNPASTDTPSDRSAKPVPQKSWRRPLMILGPVAVVVGALVLYLATGRYVTEEDAYVQAVNVSISPQTAGQVLTIAANRTPRLRRTILSSTSTPSHIGSRWPMPKRSLASPVIRPTP